MKRKVCLALAAGLMAVSSAAMGQTVYGAAQAIDGDSLEVGGKKVRLFGVDAPELDQGCQMDGEDWACGQASKEQLAALISGRPVTCQGQGVDQYGRILAVCSAGRDELNEVMVEQGWAVAYRQYSDAYVSAEMRAKAGRAGIWASQFVLPSDYRLSKMPQPPRSAETRQRKPAASAAPWSGGCVIKGNRSRRGEWIYHLPGMPYYDQTRPEEIFCTEAEAQAAGYRRAIVRP